MESEKVVITGSEGFIGSSLANEFEKRGFSFLGIDKTSKEIGSNLNLINFDSLFSSLEEYKPTIIFHAGTNSAGAYNHNFTKAYAEDSQSLVNIMKYLSNNPEVLLVFFSSSYVYSGHSNLHSYDENEMLDPSHNFGIAKLFFEKYISKCHQNSVIFRLSNVYGYGNQLNRTTLKEWIDAGLSNKDLVVWGEGLRKLQYVYIDDVTKILMSCKALPNGVFNIGGDEYTKIYELTAYLSEILDAKVIHLFDKSEGETLPFLNTEKLKSKLLNLNFSSLNKGVSKYIESVKNNE